jgi:polyphosphate kinase
MASGLAMSPTARRTRRLPAAAAAAQAEPDLEDPSLYFDRELSWLAFNERVLEQARSGHPLLERVKFFGIAANNLDEFFMVRLDQTASRARARATAMLEELWHFWQETLRGQLADAGIHLVEAGDYTDDDRTHLSRRFSVDVCPVLTPLAFDPGHPFPLVSNRS